MITLEIILQIIQILLLIGVVLILFRILKSKTVVNEPISVQVPESEKNTKNAENDVADESLRAISYKSILPLKVQACERLLLYLERIQFHMLVKRVYNPKMTVNTFHLSLNQNVREEFEHNIAQQLYVSPLTWQMINAALEDVMHQLNTLFSELPEDVDVTTAAQAVLKLNNEAICKAVAHVKAEFDSLYL